MMLEHGAFSLLLLPPPLQPPWACQLAAGFQSGLDCLVFPGNKPHHLLVTERFVFVTVWWCDWGPQWCPVQAVATHQPHPPTTQSDVSELWISLDSCLWNMNFPEETLGKTQMPLTPISWIEDTLNFPLWPLEQTAGNSSRSTAPWYFHYLSSFLAFTVIGLFVLFMQNL